MCGAAAGIAARMCVSPIDVIKIRFQVESEVGSLYRYTSVGEAARSIFQKEGIFAFWKGNLAGLLMVTPYASLQFAAFYQLQQQPWASSVKEPQRSLVFGAMSGVFATVCTYPLDLLRTRFAAQSEPRVYHSFRHAVVSIYRQHGITGLYAGLQPTLIEIVPYISVQFAAYENARTLAVQKKGNPEAKLSGWESLAIGAGTGTIAKAVTLPLDNAKKKMQVQGQFSGSESSQRPYTGMSNVLRRVYVREGMRGLFRGLVPSLLKAAPNSAVAFTVYEEARSFVHRRHDVESERR